MTPVWEGFLYGVSCGGTQTHGSSILVTLVMFRMVKRVQNS